MARRPGFKQIEIRYRKEVQRNALARPGSHDFVVVLDRLKASFNVPASSSGVINKICFEEGDEVKVGQTLAVIEEK